MAELDTQALPTGAHLIEVGNGFRVVWDLGDGLGWAWYDADPDQLKKLLGDDWESQIVESLPNTSSFKAKYGDYYWGDVAEIDLKADTPWEDLKNKVFDSFGPVAGIDTPEIKRLILQGFWESWTSNEFLSHYRQTEYYNTQNDLQRQWETLSDAEKTSLTQSKASELLSYYRGQFGFDPEGGLESLMDSAQMVASGKLDMGLWQYSVRREAEVQDGTPAYRRYNEEVQSQGEEDVNRDNLAKYVENQWRSWVGPGSMPQDFANQWAGQLYLNQKSEADLEDALKGISLSRWSTKPEDVTWESWSAPWKGRINNLLETNIGDEDPLLDHILSTGLTGLDATRAIRKDPRFLKTNLMLNELAAAAQDLGQQFGFIK